MSFGAIEYAANVLLGWNRDYDPVLMVYMVGPMGLLMGSISYASSRATTRYVEKLVAALGAAAKGEFSLRLDESRAGPYHELFSEFNTMCEELQGVQTLRDDFINHFSHEFKTPITSINGFATLLLEERVSDEERRQYLEIIASESERLTSMSTNALLMSRLDSQNYLLDKEAFALDEQIKRCAILLSPQWTKQGIDLTADLEAATFVGNADLMAQVWINLLGNAIKFTPRGGEIAVGLHGEDGLIAVSVSDTGRGMSREELERAFDKYYQGEGPRASRGLGLGLAIARKIVELHGGAIGASSEPGSGSVFTVSLPAPRPRSD